MQLKIVAVWIALGFATLVQVAKQHVEVERGEHEDINYGNFKEFLSHTLNVSHVLASIYVEDFVECAFRCISTAACFSFNIATVSSINPNNHVCHLLATDKYNHSSHFVPSQEFHHYAIASPCESYPCQNNGKCHTLYKENTYVCDCREGFMGNLCEKVIVNRCSDAPQASGIHKILNYGLDPFPVYCDQTNDGGGWTMVFKAVEGVTVPKVGELWSSQSSQSENVTAALDITTTFQGHYKNRIVQDWQKFNPKEARVVLYENGVEVVTMRFNVSGTNNLNWFSQANLISSPWNDLKTASKLQHFDITGSHSRSFEIMYYYGGCGGDQGYVVITGGSCSWETRNIVPGIQYSKLGTFVNWTDHGNVGIADVLAVFVR